MAVLFSTFLAVLALSESLMYHLAGSLKACQCLTLHFCSGFKADGTAELESFLWVAERNVREISFLKSMKGP